MLLVSLDIETSCAAPNCDGWKRKLDAKGKEKKEQCDHALDHYRNRITIIGLYYHSGNEVVQRTFRTVEELGAHLAAIGEFSLVGANLKFDLNLLHAKGYTIPWEKWSDDVTLMATCLTEKIPDTWLETYEAKRKELSALLPTGVEHREAKHHSLKTLAPYFLGIEPFWEDPSDHDNEVYVLKDCQYTYDLCQVLRNKLIAEDGYEFYRDKMMQWAKLLARMERRGVRIDLDLLEKCDADARNKTVEAKLLLDATWAEAYQAFNNLQISITDQRYSDMLVAAVAKLKPDLSPEEKSDRIDKLSLRYGALCAKSKEKGIEPLNLSSSDQMTWLLRDHFGLDIEDFDGEESTGKAVLQRLASEGREDIKTFLEFRKQKKLTTSFFPTYREMHNDGILRASFHPTVARTGRLSSSGPNLQQVPGHLHKLFIPSAPGRKMIIKDESAIEPRLITYYSEDPVLYDILDQGHDFHGYNTKIFFQLEDEISAIKKKYPLHRDVGKEVGLAILYGAGPPRLQESAQKRGFVWSLNECKYKVDQFRDHYWTIKKFHQNLDDQLHHGPVTNLFGRQFRIPNHYDIYMKGFNRLIQGSASDLVLQSARKAQEEYDRLGLDAHVVMLIHDEIVVDSAAECALQAEAILDRCMTDYDLTTSLGPVKLKVEGGVHDCWAK